MFKFLAWLLSTNKAPEKRATQVFRQVEKSAMNEGDYHSGPNGYSPNTAYPETQYGSGFDDAEEWNEHE